MSTTSTTFETANQLVSFDKDPMGGFYIRSWHPSKSEIGAYGVDSRVLTMLSMTDKRMTLQTPVVDSIGTMLMRSVQTDESGRSFADATVTEMFALASSIPGFDSLYKSFSDIPDEYVSAASENIKLLLYSSKQTISALGEPEFDEASPDVMSMAIRLKAVEHEMEIDIAGKWVPFTLRLPEVFGSVHIDMSERSYEGGKPSFNGLNIILHAGDVITITDEHLSLLIMTGHCAL